MHEGSSAAQPSILPGFAATLENKMQETAELAVGAEVAAPATRSTPVFLSAEWRNLVVLNFEIAPERLLPYLPRGTELDTFEGRSFVSMVGFRFLDTRLWGWPIPGHRHFEEVNLRFYVWRDVAGERRRGVVFVKELVPRVAVAKVARWVYNENYESLPMSHELETDATGEGRPRGVTFAWHHRGRAARLGVRVDPATWSRPMPGSLDEFIIEHYWGYSVLRDGATMEYEVSHRGWQIAPAVDWSFECDSQALYGADFSAALAARPTSAFLVDGSPVAVHRGTRLRATIADGH